MRLITQFEISAKPTRELRGLLRHAFNELAKSSPESYQRRNALASIENIRQEIGLRNASLP